MLASIVIRTLNEARYLGDLLESIGQQKTDGLEWEVVLVDSGSTDGTLDTAASYGCRIVHITREEFSFGRSLNLGCKAAKGDVLVFVSGHCVPAYNHWLQQLCEPVLSQKVAYTYGRQVGDDSSFYSERRIFAKYFRSVSSVPQEGFYCNNANSALNRQVWEANPFNEALTGLEDMELAKRLVARGHKVGYVAQACVFHHHHEAWASIRRRFERESIALRAIMPELHLSAIDIARYIVSSIVMDWRSALRNGQFMASWQGIIQYRVMQYWGSYRGNHEHRILSRQRKDKYFYPATPKQEQVDEYLRPHRRTSTDEG